MSCPVCDRGDSRPLFSAGDRLLGVPGTYHYHRCRACRTVFQSPRVVDADLPLLYPEGYYTKEAGGRPVEPPAAGGGWKSRIRRGIQDAVSATPGRPAAAGHRMLAWSRRLRERAFYDLVYDALLPWKRPAGRALDVGCGSGALMLRLRALGWTVEGLEWDESAAHVARSATGLPVHVGDATSVDPSIGSFELVVLRHVFEHLAAPVEAVAHLTSRLSGDGRLVLIYPNPTSLEARWFGPDWFHWDPPRHLVLPPPGALPLLAARSDAELLGFRTRAPAEAHFVAHSRARRSGAATASAIGSADRMLHRTGRLLAALGLSTGEEVVASLRGAPVEESAVTEGR